jgi:hypothetical protein
MWSETKVKEMDIRGTQAENDLRDMQSKWRNDATTFISKSIEAEDCSYAKEVTVSDWIWARATLQARGFSFYSRDNQDVSDSGEGHSIVSFIPFITLSNHDDTLGGVTTMGKDPYPPSSYTFRTSSEKTDAGCQLFNYYGAISFQQKMLSFGWVDRCPAASPEGFCITALSISSSSSSSPVGKTADETRPVQTIEIKSNILLASAVAELRRKEKSNKLESSPLSNSMSLQVTLLKFEIRSVISRIVDQGMSREEAVAGVTRALIERKAMLEGSGSAQHEGRGVDVEQPLTASSAPPKVKASASTATMRRQKSKVKAGKGKGQGGEAVSGAETESDGRYIRRTEAEAVDLLLSYVSTC